MRIIAGRFRSRRLKPVSGSAVRPTPDRLRESLFSILQPRLEGARFADIYAGTGSVGFEALSRGAAHVTFLERSPAALGVLRENAAALGLQPEEFTVLRGSAARLLPEVRCDILFVDPPYTEPKEYQAVYQALDKLEDSSLTLVILQHATRFSVPTTIGPFVKSREVRQGDNTLTFFEPSPQV